VKGEGDGECKRERKQALDSEILEKIVKLTEVIVELANVINDQDNPKAVLGEGQELMKESLSGFFLLLFFVFFFIYIYVYFILLLLLFLNYDDNIVIYLYYLIRCAD
jgi:hypothetical protein